MSDFLFDTDISDKDHSIRISVTRVDADNDDVQINLRPGDKYAAFPTMTFFLSLAAARDLGEALIAACDAEESEPEGPDPDALRDAKIERDTLFAAWTKLDTSVEED